MEQRTCDIIMCCKGHCRLPGGKGKPALDAVAAYMAKECACPQEDYKGQLMETIMKEAMFDFMRTADNPSFEMRQLFNPVYTHEPSLSERIATMFSLTQVNDLNGHPTNGFTKQVLEQSKIDLGESVPDEQNSETPFLSDETLDRLHREAYRKYQLHWLIDQGHTALDVAECVLEYAKENVDPDDPEASDARDILAAWENEDGLHGSIWVCFDEFMGAEYEDEDYMSAILTDAEFAIWKAEHKPA